jgi:hypothetical protein
MLARSLGRSEGTYLITEHKNKTTIPEESNTLPEQEYWRQAFPSRTGEEVPRDSQAFDSLWKLWNAQADGRRLIIKNPRNVVRAREIRTAFPNARFVWIIRNPWSVIQSMVKGKREGAMILYARDVLELPSDPVLQSAASWAFGVRMMQEVPGLTVRYEDIVATPEEQLSALGEQLSLSRLMENGAAEIPANRPGSFAAVRYMLSRTPYARDVMDMIGPLAAELCYPGRPPGFPWDTYVLRAKYLRRWIRREKDKPPYGYPRLEKLRALVRRARHSMGA